MVRVSLGAAPPAAAVGEQKRRSRRPREEIFLYPPLPVIAIGGSSGTLCGVTTPQPRRFATQWISNWNARDVEAVLADCAEDVIFTSPTAVRVVPESGGTVRGKDALRRYWTLALQRNPDLHFGLVGVYAGVDTLALHYQNQRGNFVIEVLTFQDGLITVGHATHLLTDG